MEEMGSGKDVQRELEEMLQNLPHEVRIVEYGVDSDTMLEYRVLAEELKEIENTLLIEDIEWAEMPAEALKRALIQVADVGSIDAYRKLEEFEQGLGDLSESSWEKEWAQLALLQCRMILENDLSDEPIGFIATGLGGRGNKIRYVFVLKSSDVITEGRAKFVEQEYEDLIKEVEAEIESFEFNDYFIKVKMLVPYKKSLLDIIIQGLEHCDFLDEEFLVTNIKEPTEKDIEEWIQQMDQNNEDDFDIEIDLENI